MLRLLPILIIALSTALHGIACAVDYELIPPRPPIIANRASSFHIKSVDPIEVGDLPDHPNLTWVGATTGTLVVQGDGKGSGRFFYTNAKFVVHSPGTIQLPPLPVEIGGITLRVPVPPFETVPNPLPEDDARLIVLWNGSRTPPEFARVGQTIDLEILQLITQKDGVNPIFSTPYLEFEGVRWHQFGVVPSQSNRYARFFPLGPKFYSEASTNFQDRPYDVRRYKARFMIPRSGEITGLIHASLGTVSGRRTALVSASFPARPLPDPPAASFTDTGLVGDWSFEASLDPPQPAAGQPFTLTLDIEGTGEETRLQELDFSRPGFPSLNSSLETKDDSTFDRWRARFTQTLLPSGETPVFPAITLASFDNLSDSWKLHPVTQRSVLAGYHLPSEKFAPATTLGPAVPRPVLLNLPMHTFLAFGLAPFLPLATGLLLYLLNRRNPARAARRKQMRALTTRLRGADSETASTLISRETLPLLRSHLELPGGASTREVADALDPSAPELATLLREQAEADFSGTKGPDPAQIANRLARLALTVLLLLIPSTLPAASLDEANAAYSNGHYDSAIDLYQELLATNADHPALHQNLAKALLAADRLTEARAVCHTALLLQPRDRETRALMNRILLELGHPALPGSTILALRPDQLIILASIVWVLGFSLLAARQFIPLPNWLPVVIIVLAPLLIGAAFWRNQIAYANDQFMVIADEVPRELTAGTPSFEYPPLKDGDIVRSQGANSSKTHILVETPATTFWLPVTQVRQIW